MSGGPGTRRAAHAALVLQLAFAAACAGGPPVYRPPAYGSEPPPPAPSASAEGPVGAPDAAGAPHAGPSLVVRLPEDARPPHHREGLSSWLEEYGGWTGEAVTRDAVWVRPPPEMVADGLAARLRATGRFSAVRVGPEAEGDLVLDWRLRRLRGWEGYHVQPEEAPQILEALGDVYLDRVRIRDPDTGRLAFDGQAGASVMSAAAEGIDPYALAREAVGRALDRLAASIAQADLGRSLEAENHLSGAGSTDELLDALPGAWRGERAEDSVPYGWESSAPCRRLALRDPSRHYYNPTLGDYAPFVDLWVCPSGWTGRMRLSGEDSVRFPALVLGTDPAGRAVLMRTLGQSSWPAATDELARYLRLSPAPPQVMRLPLDPEG